MNIYVGNLSYQCTDEDLHGAFSAYGAVSSAKVITDKFTGQSRGFGFVEMENDAEGSAAINGLNGKELKGRQLKVNEARPKTEDSRGGGGRSGGGGYRSSGGSGW